ncbi:MAG TPA: LacI family DNA-binding transcriptional regulator [Terracidiphilus sp.]|jgi:LacI family transcriptional regulator|nr:LacI family DNA-binding transcriptional regulator [Terracidiphilus sp.]
MPTLLDVAKVAGVGVMSVSRVVNGTRKVSAETERRVRAAIDRIGYQPNEAARVLKGQRAHILGLIVPDLADPFFAACANAIQETARTAGYLTLMAASGHREDVERQEAEIMLQRQIAGLIVIPSGTKNDYYQEAVRSGLPIVSLDRPLDHVDADAIVVDNRDASIRVTEHLISHGHRGILCVADDETIFTRMERVAGYSQAMRKAGLPIRLCTVGPTTGALSDQLDFALNSMPAPTAIFAINDVLAVGILHELQKRSLRIPDKMALIAFDDFEAASLVRPTVSVVKQPTAELGKRAASLLLERLNKSGPPELSRVVLPTELVIRESCGCKTPRKKH